MKSSKTVLVVFIVLISFPMSLLSQTIGKSDKVGRASYVDKSSKKVINKLSISPSFGLLHSWDDFKTDDFMPSFLQAEENKLGFGLLLNYKISNVFSLSAGGLMGSLTGSLENINTLNASNNSVDYGFGINYRTDLFELILPRVDANITQAIFKDNSNFFNQVSISLFSSLGLLYYDSKVYAESEEGVNLLYSKTRGRTGKTTERVISFGGLVNYKVNEKISIGLESSIRAVNNDKLDAWVSGENNDRFSYTAIKLTYRFKKVVNEEKRFEENKLLAQEAKEAREELKKELKAELKEELKEELILELKEKEEVLDDDINHLTEDKILNLNNSENSKEINPKREVTPRKKIEPKKNSNAGHGYYLVVEAYRDSTKKSKLTENLEMLGENPVVIRNLNDTWSLVTIGLFPSKEEALLEMKKARDNGYESAWIHIK